MILKKKSIKNIVHFLLISVIFCITDISISQETNFNEIVAAFSQNNYKKVQKKLTSIDTTLITEYDKATWLYYFADLQYRIDKHGVAFSSIIKSKNIFIKEGKFNDAIDCNILTLAILSHQNRLDINTSKLISETENLVLKKGDSLALATLYRRIGGKYINLENGEKAIEYFKKIIPIAIKQNDSIKIGYSYENIGTSFKYTTPIQLDSTIYYLKKATPFYIKYKDYVTLAYNYNNQGQYYKKINKLKLALKYLKKADSIPLTKHLSKSKLIFYQNLSETYNKLKDYKNEALYLKKISVLKDSINNTKQNIAISDLDKKYKTAEKEKENLQLKIDKQNNKNYFITALLTLILISVIGILSLKNSKRKRKLAEQEKALASQKNLTLLKEQEIITINAIVAGQEKERTRIAEDLHDNLGSVLATLKLHFENLQINHQTKKINQEVLFEKTEKLIDEAYLKVRSIAHAKNAGVIANQGLLTAVKMMAEKISSADKIKIEVISFGLEKRLDNSLEITIFRITQELITNILKHAEAKNVTINLASYDKNINIIVEDDGKGFDAKKISLKKGMGINSINTRIQHLKGTLEIDSTIGKGTSIIINIPIT